MAEFFDIADCGFLSFSGFFPSLLYIKAEGDSLTLGQLRQAFAIAGAGYRVALFAAAADIHDNGYDLLICAGSRARAH